MNTKKEKAVFLAAVKNEIAHRETLRTFFGTTFQDLTKKFDGKVYNRRFENALNDALKAVSPSMWCACKIQGPTNYTNIAGATLINVTLNYYNFPGNYINVESLPTNLVLHDGRICAEDSAREKYTILWAANFDEHTEERKTILKNYDAFMSVADMMNDAIKKYNALPYRFRENIEKPYIY